MPEIPAARTAARGGIRLFFDFFPRIYMASHRTLSHRTTGFVALAGAIIGYGGLWPVTRIAIETIPPLWYATMRIGIGAAVLFGVLAATGQLKFPTRDDLPLVVSVAVFMMAIYTALMHLALQFVEAGRAALLGYTTPLWVIPAAYLMFGERPSRRRVAGLAVALTGLAVLFNPASFDWTNANVLAGNLMLLCCGLSWSIAIIHIRKHRPQRTPFQLAPFQLTLAAMLSALLALVAGPLPSIAFSGREIAVLAYGGVIGTALAMVSVTTCVRYLPTTVSTVGLLGGPVFALTLSVAFLDEALTAALAAGIMLILLGIALVSAPERRPAEPPGE